MNEGSDGIHQEMLFPGSGSKSGRVESSGSPVSMMRWVEGEQPALRGAARDQVRTAMTKHT